MEFTSSAFAACAARLKEPTLALPLFSFQRTDLSAPPFCGGLVILCAVPPPVKHFFLLGPGRIRPRRLRRRLPRRPNFRLRDGVPYWGTALESKKPRGRQRPANTRAPAPGCQPPVTEAAQRSLLPSTLQASVRSLRTAGAYVWCSARRIRAANSSASSLGCTSTTD